MSFENLIYEKKANILFLTINRKESLNALNVPTVKELYDAIKKAEQDSDLRVVILTGAGNKAFVAGADIKQMSTFNRQDAIKFSKMGHELMTTIEMSHLVFIAAVNGYALGGGCELALSCDIIYASQNAKFGQPEVNLGIIPGFGGCLRLMQAVGPYRAKEMIFSGRHYDADEAYKMGLVQKVVPSDRLLQETTELAQKIASSGPQAVKAAKRVITSAMDITRKQILMEIEAFASIFTTDDAKEGITAFVEKRKPEFKDS